MSPGRRQASAERSESVKRVTGKKIHPLIASPSDIDRLLVDSYGVRRSARRAEEGGVEAGNQPRAPEQALSRPGVVA